MTQAPAALASRRSASLPLGTVILLPLLGLGLACGGGGASHQPVPQLTGVEPGSGGPGSEFTLQGSGFLGVTAVRLVAGNDAVPAVVLDHSPTSLRLRVPATLSAGPRNLQVEAAAGRSEPSRFTFMVLAPAPAPAPGFDPRPPTHGSPVITSMTPTNGGPGSEITIQGHHFEGATASVRLTGPTRTLEATILDRTPTTLRVRIPADAPLERLRVTVTTPAGSSPEVNSDFTVHGNPQITAVEPLLGRPGTTVHITGQHFEGVRGIWVDAEDDLHLQQLPLADHSATRLTIHIPALATGSWRMRLAIPGRDAMNTPDDFHFLVTEGEPGGGGAAPGPSLEERLAAARSAEAAEAARTGGGHGEQQAGGHGEQQAGGHGEPQGGGAPAPDSPQARAESARRSAEANAERAGMNGIEIARRGAEAAARALGRTGSEVSQAGAQAVLELRRGRGNTLGALAGHTDATVTLIENLHRNQRFVGAANQVFDMRTEYELGKGALDRFRNQHHAPGEYYINLEYLDADPYLAFHNEDINQLVPNEVTAEEWATICAALRANIEATNVFQRDPGRAGHLERSLAEINGGAEPYRGNVKKRIKRLYDDALACRGTDDELAVSPGLREARVTRMGDLAYQVSRQQQDNWRCIEGTAQGIQEFEAVVFANGGGGPALNLGEFISMVVADYKAAFIRQHRALYPTSAEFPAMVEQILRQKMLYSLGLRGGYAPVYLGGYGETNGPLMASDRVMQRFLAGSPAGGERLDASRPAVIFEAYTVDKLIQLLQQARLRSIGGQAAQGLDQGAKLTTALIREECVDPNQADEAAENYTVMRDPVLGPAFNQFEMRDGYRTSNRCFEANQQNMSAFMPTREFYLHILMKYGYILRQPQ